MGGGWWMVDGGGWVEKKFFNFSQNLHIDSTPQDIFGLFFVMADQFSKEFNVKKWILDFAETCNTLSLDGKKIGKKIS